MSECAQNVIITAPLSSVLFSRRNKLSKYRPSTGLFTIQDKQADFKTKLVLFHKLMPTFNQYQQNLNWNWQMSLESTQLHDKCNLSEYIRKLVIKNVFVNTEIITVILLKSFYIFDRGLKQTVLAWGNISAVTVGWPSKTSLLHWGKPSNQALSLKALMGCSGFHYYLWPCTIECLIARLSSFYLRQTKCMVLTQDRIQLMSWRKWGTC